VRTILALSRLISLLSLGEETVSTDEAFGARCGR
jgi:hypothetical protein